jgi:hypothetical protein
MFGYHDIPLKIKKEGVSIFTKRVGDHLSYKREYTDEKVEKILLTKTDKILINPIEPLHKPKELTPYLLIELEKAIVIEPRAAKKVFLKFPIEMGVFISGQEDFKILDIITLMKQKLTLYGEVRGGIICKYWFSEVYTSIPSLNPIKEGVIELTITNSTPKWHELSKVVFNAYGMKIYYNENNVSMRSHMKIMSGGIAEIDFYDSPIYKEMKKALELYTARKLRIAATKFVMEWGL